MRSELIAFILVSATVVAGIKTLPLLRRGDHCFALLLVGFLIFAIYKTYIYPNFFSPLRHIPQPDGSLPFIGHDLAAFQQPPAQDFGRWMREVENDGLVCLHEAMHLNLVSKLKILLTQSIPVSRYASVGSLDAIACSSPTRKRSLKSW